MIINLILLVLLGSAIWMAGTRLAYLADAIAEKTGIARALLGLVLLAAATELPELVTTLTSCLAGNAALALNNMFGGITMQTAILAVADMMVVHVTLTSFPRKSTPILEGLLLILLLGCLLTVTFVQDVAILPSLGLASICMAILYLVSLRILQKSEEATAWRPIKFPDELVLLGKRPNINYGKYTLKNLIRSTIGAAVVILICGVSVVHVAESLAVQTGLGSSFVGVTLLAAATSLPELSTTIAAVRMRNFTMAISNIFGSNLIMLFLIFPADVLYFKGPLLNEIDEMAAYALVSGVIVTAIYCIGLLTRRNIRIWGMGIDSLLVLVVYVCSLFVFYTIS